MRVISTTLKVLCLTPSEIKDLQDMVMEAQRGTTVHYAERQQPNGSYFGISVDAQYEYTPRPPLKRA